jgi:CRP/FNR family transcriptional regulator
MRAWTRHRKPNLDSTSQDTVEALRQALPALADLPPELSEELGRHVRRVSLPTGSQVFRERDECMGFPIVLSGKVRVSKSLESGREVTLYEVADGESCVISTSCLLGSVPYGARGECLTDVDLAILPRDTFDRLVAEHRPFREEIFAIFGERLNQLMDLVEAVGFQRLDRRLAATLLGHGQRLAQSHQDIATELGASRESVSRLLKQFELQGWVRLGRGEIEIVDAARLRKVAAGEEVPGR